MEETIVNIISNVGFPIAVSVALFYQVNRTNEMYLDVIREFKGVIDNNTKSINDLSNAVKYSDLGGKQ